MSDLSDTQIASFRTLSGDTDPDRYAVTADEIQAFYDAALAATSDPDRQQARVVVEILRRRMGQAVNETDAQGQLGTDRNSQKFTNIKDRLLPYWESRAGLVSEGGVAAGFSVISMRAGIDSYED